MLTPPYHWSIVAAPLHAPTAATQPPTQTEILYRGSIPSARNLAFLKPLGIRTIVYLQKTPIDDGDGLVRWAQRRKVELKWIKAEEMSEEKLGIGKAEMSDVLRVILDRSAYPLYLADIDGVSHTTLAIACLRKLQGWHMDSIIDEICRFEPDHEEYSLVSFITSYLSGPDSTLTLPSPPYPVWLWPTSGPSQPTSSQQAQTTQSSQPTIQSIQPPQASQTPLQRTSTREPRERDRSHSTTTPTNANTTPPGPLPFPHPLTARKHPTMRLTFPPLPPTPSTLLPSANPNNTSRQPNRPEKQASTDDTNPNLSNYGSITGVIGVASPIGIDSYRDEGQPGGNGSYKAARLVSFSANKSEPGGTGGTVAGGNGGTAPSSGHTSPGKLSRHTTFSSREPSSLSDTDQDYAGHDPSGEEVSDEQDESEEEYEESDEEDEEEVEPTSQYISALDLANFS